HVVHPPHLHPAEHRARRAADGVTGAVAVPVTVRARPRVSLLVLAVLAIVVAGGVLLPAPTRLCDLLGGAPAACPGSYPWTGPAWWSLLVLMLFSVAVLLRNQVRVDESGVTHRTLLRTRTLTRDQLDAAILHRYLRHS